MFSDDLPARRPGAQTWHEPFHWWGPPWNPAPARTLAELVALDMLSDQQAAWLTRHVRNGGSVVVAAGPQGAGKSTLAHALIQEIPPDRQAVYVRGMYETFEWEEATEPERTTLLVNEISPHLPIYAWSETARRVLVLAESGSQVIATLHADTIEEVIAQLAAYPIRATASQLAALDVVVFLTVAVACDTLLRRVSAVVELGSSAATGGLIAHPVTE
jgi:type IV secretory pathway ATPase VirB11/archaellum biosynthesis ATPase